MAESKRKDLDMPRYRWHALMLLLLVFAMAGCHSLAAAERDPQAIALLDRIWPELPPAKRVLNPKDQEYAEAALTHLLETYLRREYEVVDQRFFWVSQKTSAWSALVKQHAGRIESEWGGVRVGQAWNEMGFDRVELWKVDVAGEERYFAIAMTRGPVPGTRAHLLVGRYELKKRPAED